MLCGSSSHPIVADHDYICPCICLLACEHFGDECHVGESSMPDTCTCSCLLHDQMCLLVCFYVLGGGRVSQR